MKKIISFIIVLFSVLIAGCGFHLRSSANFPTELNTLYFTSEKPYSILSVQLRQLFHSMRVQLVNRQTQARFSLIVSNDHFSYSRPDVVNASLPSTMSYSQTATLAIEDNRTHVTLGTRSFGTSQNITLNTNQIYTANSNDLIQQQLNRDMISLIYYWLLSSNIKQSLHHAAITKTTRHAS